MPDESLFTALGRYPSSPAVRPLENYTTELVCWLVNSFPSFGCRLGALLAPARTLFTTVRAETQRAIGASGIVDLVLDAVSSTGQAYTLLVECKIEADIGEREGATVESGVDDETSETPASSTQIDNYLKYAEMHDCQVAVISKYPVEIRERWQRNQSWVTARTWFAVDRELRGCKGREGEAYAFVADQTHMFFVEHNMAFNKIGSELREGTRYRHYLWSMLVEAATAAAAQHGFTVRKGHDKWGVYAEWRNQANTALGGMMYSDNRGDIGIWMAGSWYQKLTDPSRLREQQALADAKGPKTGRFWGEFYVPVQLDDRFFALDADDQLEMLIHRGSEVLDAFVAVGGTG